MMIHITVVNMFMFTGDASYDNIDFRNETVCYCLFVHLLFSPILLLLLHTNSGSVYSFLLNVTMHT